MDQNKFQSSFIPKSGNSGFEQGFKKSRVGLFGVIVFLGTIAVLVFTLGILIYNQTNKSAIESLRQEIALAEASIDTKTIDQMFAFSNKLSVAKDLVARHRIVSSFLHLLSQNVVQTVSFNEFSYQFLAGGELQVNLSGLALDYGSVALQEKIFLGLKEVKSVQFSDMGIVERGRVGFRVVVLLDPSSAIYNPDNLIGSETPASKEDFKEELDVNI